MLARFAGLGLVCGGLRPRGLYFQVCALGEVRKRRKRPLKRLCFNGLPFVVLSCLLLFGVGGFLLSHNLPVAVPSALAGLASGFGMGPGVSLLL